MIRFLTLRVIRLSLKNTLPKINSKLYNKIFNLSYKFFIFLKPSKLWVIILALLNKTDFRSFLSIPSMFLLFSTILSDFESIDTKLDNNLLYAKLHANKFTDSENKWENFFWIVIILALITRFIKFIFKFLWIPFKIAFIFYILKYFGYDFSNLFNTLNNLSLGIINWFYIKITNFFNFFLFTFTEIENVI